MLLTIAAQQEILMQQEGLPKTSVDLLKVPDAKVPDVIQSLLHQRALSRLVLQIHSEIESQDPDLRHQAVRALRRLGFPE
jgi:hypothetical protein